MKLTVITNKDDDTIFIFPKNAPAGFVSQMRRVTKLKNEYVSVCGYLVFVIKD